MGTVFPFIIYYTAACSLPSGGMEERIKRTKVRKLVGSDKDTLIGKAKTMQAKQTKEFIHCFLSAGRCSAILRKAGLYPM